MQPYSHILIANRLEPLLRPESPPEYYLGAVFPDIRYISPVKRETTHIKPGKVLELLKRYPGESSFLKGYLVHILTDEIPMKSIISSKTLFRYASAKLGISSISVILEVYNLEKVNVRAVMSDQANTITRELGVADEDVIKFAAALNGFLAQPSVESGLKAAENLGILDLSSTGMYIRTLEKIRGSKIIKPMVYALAKPEKAMDNAEQLVKTGVKNTGLTT